MVGETTPATNAGSTAQPPAARQPTEAEKAQDALVNAITETFKADAKLSEVLIASVRKGSTMAAAVDAAFKEKRLYTPPYVRALLARTLDRFTHSDAQMMPSLLRTAVAMDLSLADIATKFYKIPSDMSFAASDNESSWQEGLFTQEPAAVLLGLVDRDEILVDEKLKPAILSLFRLAVKKGTLPLSQIRATSLIETGDVVLSNDLRTPLIESFEDIQRLQNLVRLPQHVGTLLQAGFKSAYSVATTGAAPFVLRMTKAGIPLDDARRIHDHATTIEIRNEQAWATALRERNDLIDLSSTPLAGPAAQSSAVTRKEATDGVVNLANLFKDTISIECADCSSVTSPSAYYVDLLRFLQEARKDPASPTAPSLFTNLMKRRPDLPHIQLSCSNTNLTIPYIDLVNELLEYFVLNVNGKTSGVENDFTRYNSSKLPDGEKGSQQPQNMNTDVYRNHVLQQMFPIAQLPYSYSTDTIRVILEALGASREEVLTTFRADEAMLGMTPPSGSNEYSGVEKERASVQNQLASTRAVAAESLGLLPEDFLAITGEGFESVAFFKAWAGVNQEVNYDNYRWYHDSDWRQNLTAAGLWGYRKESQTTAVALMLDDKNGTGLTFIKRQLLPRSSLSMSELLELLSTQFIGRRLTIVADTSDGTFTDEMDNMRLKVTNLVTPDSDKLTEAVCNDLQAFIRLRKKTGMSIVELDSIISCSLRSDVIPTDSFSITAGVIEDLAAARQISVLTHMTIPELQPLWGSMDTNGPKSLYAQLFYRPRLVAQDPVFVILGKGETPKDKAISQHRTVIMAALGIIDKDLDILIEAANLKSTDPLSLKAISLLYRVHVLYTIFGIKNVEYTQLLTAMSASVEAICRTPQQTLQYLKQWQDIAATGLTIEDLTQVIPNKDYTLPNDSVLNLSMKINAGMMAIEQTYPLHKSDHPSYEEIQKVASSVFKAVAVPSIISFIEGTYTANYNIKSTTARVPPELAKKAAPKLKWEAGKEAGEGRVTLIGLLTADEKIAALALWQEEPNWKLAIEFLHNDSRNIFDQIKPRLQISETEAEKAFASPPLDEDSRTVRRQLMLSSCIPILRAQLTRQIILDVLTAEFNSVDPASLLVILTDTIQISSGSSEKSALDLLRTLCDLAPSDTGFSGYFIPPTTNSFVFVSQNMKSELSLDGQVLKPEGFSTSPRLQNGKPYKLVYKGNLMKEVRLMPKDGLIPSSIPATSLLDERIVAAIRLVYRGVVAASKLTSVLKFTPEEIQYFHRGRGRPLPLTCNFNNMTYRSLQELVSYYSLRQTLGSSSQPNKTSLLAIFAYCEKDVVPNQESRSLSQLYAKISEATGWPAKIIGQILVQKYPKRALNSMLALFRGVDELRALRGAISLSQRLTKILPSLEVSTLFSIAFRKSYTKMDPYVTEWPSAEKLRLATINSMGSSEALRSAIDTLRSHRRAALLAYLLNHDAVKKLGLINEDSLFEYLLIDVQMGPELLTSRIKQAISTVHLYVQRCLLGLEDWEPVQSPAGQPAVAPTKVQSSLISKIRWSYLSQYTLWEANRKIFLYPENWIDPVLRDNKSDVFKQFEACLQSNNLDKDTIDQAIKSYIYEANELAHLEFQTYLWEYVDTSISKYHFFARTKHEPYQYYYRMFKYSKIGDTWIHRWDSWKKIDIDIPSQDVDFDGQSVPGKGAFLVPALLKGRLYLFLPQVLYKPIPNLSTEVGTVKSMLDKPVGGPQTKPRWEIKLAWTELRNEKWTPKQLSSEALTAYDETNVKDDLVLQRLASLRFWVRNGSSKKGNERNNPASDDVLVFDVEGWFYTDKDPGDFNTDKAKSVSWRELDDEDHRYFSYGWRPTVPARRWPIGRFRVVGSEVKVDSDSASGDQEMFVPSYFSAMETNTGGTGTRKGIQRAFPKLNEGLRVRGNNEHSVDLVVALPESVEVGNRRLKWILGLNTTYSIGPTALILEATTDSGSKRYFSCRADPKNTALDQAQDIDMNHPYAFDLMERTTHADDIKPIYQYLSEIRLPQAGWDAIYAFGGVNPKGHETRGFTEQSYPHSLYVWEMSLHIVMLLMERLLSTQQFELALDIARLVFDPRVGGDLTECWKFLPFRDPATATMGSAKESLTSKAGVAGSKSFTAWKENPFSPHAVARDRPVAYMKRVVMKYIEILIAAGDEFFRRGTLESLPLAIQRYVEASQLFGPRPRSAPPLGAKAVKTFAQLDTSFNNFSNAGIDIELEFPYSCDPRFRGSKGASTAVMKGPKPNPFMGIAKTTYFCVPTNPKVVALRDLIDDRLYKIRNSQDINGNVRSLLLWEPPIDPGLLVQAQAAGMSPSLLLADMDAPMPNYRFLYLLQKAFDLCAELKSIGEAFLAAKEKRDAEAFNLLRARQDVVSQTMLIDVKLLQKTEIQKSMDVLEETRKSHVMRLSHYLELTGEPLKKVPDERTAWEDVLQEVEKPTMDDLRMTSNEKTEMDKADSAARLTESASALDAIASGLLALPNLTTAASPMGVGMHLKIDAENVAKCMAGTAMVLKLKAEMDSHDGARASRKAQLIRQLQDRRMSANLAGHDIKVLDKELEVSRVRLAICGKDIDVQKKQVEQVMEVNEYYHSKYTNDKLYAWMENSIRSVYYDTYLASMQIARKAEKAFLFENPGHGNRPSYLAQTGFWDSGREGLLSANNIYLSLKKLEATYLEKRSHDFELSKTISLRQISPTALLSLRDIGKAEFSLPEILFDMDFPGHYMRRIKTISVSMPCIIGPYTGTNCIITLAEHRMRVSSRKGDKYEDQGREDERFRSDRVPMTSIAMSSGQNDTGLFELNINDERYLPFEGAGVISRWKVEFPSALRQFDYNSISDLVMQVRYTSINGGTALQKAANDSLKSYLKTVSDLDVEKGGFSTLLDLKNDFPNEWYQFVAAGEAFTLSNVRDRLPFWTRGASLITAKTLYLIFVAGTEGEEQKTLVINWAEKDKVVFEDPGAATLSSRDGVFSVAKGTSVCEVEGLQGKSKLDAKWKLRFKMGDKVAREAIGGLYAVLRYGVEFKV